MQSIIDIIEKHSLTVRCLPHVVVNHWSPYKEGDENVKRVDSNGNTINSKYSVVTREDGKKLLREERIVDKGGWWYVKETKNTDSTVTFNRKNDKFFAPTLAKAIKLYLDSKS